MNGRELDEFDKAHIEGGECLIRGTGEPDLVDNEPLWRSLWETYGDELTAEHIHRNPGTRPKGWWKFTHDRDLEPLEGEAQVETLDRLGLIGPEELAAIRKEALGLVDYNSVRSPAKTAAGYYQDNFVPPGDLAIFAANRGLLTGRDLEILGLRKDRCK